MTLTIPVAEQAKPRRVEISAKPGGAQQVQPGGGDQTGAGDQVGGFELPGQGA